MKTKRPYGEIRIFRNGRVRNVRRLAILLDKLKMLTWYPYNLRVFDTPDPQKADKALFF